MVGEKEMLWEKIARQKFDFILNRVNSSGKLFSCEVGFHDHPLRINVRYDNVEFGGLLKEKFKISGYHADLPQLTFTKNTETVGLTLPYYQYGYVSEDGRNAVAFASSFGVFKSVISGFASFCLDSAGYVPVHGSVMMTNSAGIILTGGTSAGKTTVLLHLVDALIKRGLSVKVLTDDWAVVSKQEQGYMAETFDPSISLREKDLLENARLRLDSRCDLLEAIRRKTKISIRPEKLYGLPIGIDKVRINTVILLKPEAGSDKLEHIDSDDLASEIVDAAYHYPYVSAEQVRRHKKFWERAASKINIFSFATRPMKGRFQNVDAIRRIL